MTDQYQDLLEQADRWLEGEEVEDEDFYVDCIEGLSLAVRALLDEQDRLKFSIEFGQVLLGASLERIESLELQNSSLRDARFHLTP